MLFKHKKAEEAAYAAAQQGPWSDTYDPELAELEALEMEEASRSTMTPEEAAAAEQQLLAELERQEQSGGGAAIPDTPEKRAEALAFLENMHAEGVLTDEELAAEKAKILGI